MIWVFISELFPRTKERAVGQTVGAATHWCCAVVLTLVFPWLVDSLSPARIFGFFCAITCAQMVWVVLEMPETKGVALEEMEAHLARGHTNGRATEGSGGELDFLQSSV